MESTQAVAWQLNSEKTRSELGVEGIRAARLPRNWWAGRPLPRQVGRMVTWFPRGRKANFAPVAC